ncbi:MAG: amidohydrolase family protein [Halioglobus sp.]
MAAVSFKSLVSSYWFGGAVFGEAGHINIGADRASQSQVVGDFVRAGANVTLSSDVVSGDEAYRANPFIGLEMSISRQEYGGDKSAPVLSPASAAITLEAAIKAYTVNGARQLDKENELGSLVAGKLADFVVLDKNPFDVEIAVIHQIKPVATVIGGRLVYGKL